jgi:hypothetical protein
MMLRCRRGIGNPKIMDIKSAFMFAKEELSKYTRNQTPRICGKKRLKWFPFAVKL